jgi:hypothetical protein
MSGWLAAVPPRVGAKESWIRAPECDEWLELPQKGVGKKDLYDLIPWELFPPPLFISLMILFTGQSWNPIIAINSSAFPVIFHSNAEKAWFRSHCH